jgi:hypothetical protein
MLYPMWLGCVSTKQGDVNPTNIGRIDIGTFHFR